MSGERSTLARRQLGKYLREGREGCGFTLARVGTLIDRSTSTVQRIEKGLVTRLRMVDVEALCALYGFDDEKTAAMKALATQGIEEPWWCGYDDILGRFDFYVGLESSAELITTFESEVVPGLLQTAGYAHALMRAGYPRESLEQRSRRVQVRMRRQSRITRKYDPMRLNVIVQESVLRVDVGGRGVMGPQLTHLADMSLRPNVELRVLPFGAGLPMGVSIGSFVLLDFGTDKRGKSLEPQVVYTERFAGDLYFDRPRVVERYHRAYESMRWNAMDPVASRTLLRRTAKECE
ncbi:helix-turn-helix domain-containing protein [Nocardia puris]|uniref:helix-turn-helix domain-containing protein n=1 Tax=Nocardia puris TaxID=208602 RepID=UPI001894CAD0|nr:helix-turn-helix transcriptional regulator [Nocardia puris]MBF6209992.1 helix-turn-helix domain-containing protein [Nocardia puris]MBF6368183.1 helix-turn-helix domain-containing protein [Nocardia puris]MBF6458098.1 helix-turn-helix domain-containing protein [Nocardia puris]